MTPSEIPVPRKKTPLSARRFVLLASVAGLGAAALVGGPHDPLNLPGLTPPAHAAEALRQPSGFADLVAKVKPAVISVRVKIDRTAETTGMGEGADSPCSRAPRSRSSSGNSAAPACPTARRSPVQVITGEGSGFFISPDGYAVTNNHVVDHAKSVEIKTDDGATYTAKVIGTDSKTDLALIKVDAKTQFAYVRFSDQAPRVGDWVVAVGNPFGLGGTVTAGIVSARGRDIGAGPYDDYIQIDAPINKGNSGGPAFDIDGNVIGVNTAIFSPSGGSVGIGFDIPAETAKLVVAQLKDSGHVTRGWIGVQIQPLTADIAESLGLKQAQGALVAEPQAGSPAAKAGVAAGDVITAMNGAPVKDARDLARKIGTMAPGSAVKLDILRNGGAKTLSVTLGEMPNERQAKADTAPATPSSGVPHLGLQLAPANDVAGSGHKGVVVMGVEPGGPASERGVKTGDVILDVGGKPVANAGDVRNALAAARQQGRHDVLLRVKRADATRFVALPLG